MTPAGSPGDRSGAVRRAAPRLTFIAGLAVLLWLAHEGLWGGGGWGGFLWGLAFVSLVAAVVRSLNPAWVRYVRSGEEPPGWLASEPPGEWDVVLDAPGSRPIATMRVLREAIGGSLAPVREAVEGTPSTVARGVCASAADRLVAAVIAAGGSARTEPAG